jgi:hypothetical protein
MVPDKPACGSRRSGSGMVVDALAGVLWEVDENNNRVCEEILY